MSLNDCTLHIVWKFTNLVLVIRLSAQTGYITDGMSNYSTDLQCTWLIDSGKPEATIRLQLVEFETECSWDHLYIFDGDSVFAPLVAAYSGLLLKDGQAFQEVPEIVVTSGRAYLYFYSDAAYNMSGFNVSYSVDSCPRNCSRQGACISGVCTCDGGWDGEACDQVICPEKCSDHGQCDLESRRCICDPGYAGPDCRQVEAHGYWSQVDVTSKVEGRSLHQAVVFGDSMWVAGGEFFRNPKIEPSFLVRYDFRLKKWESVRASSPEPSPRFAHSLVAHDGRLYLYGGILSNGTVVNSLWTFDMVSSSWERQHSQCITGYCSPLAAMGHTANLIDNKMIVIFGHNPVYGYLNTVQEFNIGKQCYHVSREHF